MTTINAGAARKTAEEYNATFSKSTKRRTMTREKPLILKTNLPESLYSLIEVKFQEHTKEKVSKQQRRTLWNDCLVYGCFLYEHVFCRHRNQLTNIHHNVLRYIVGDSEREATVKQIFRDGILHVNHAYCANSASRLFPKSYSFERSLAPKMTEDKEEKNLVTIEIKLNRRQFHPLLKNELKRGEERTIADLIFDHLRVHGSLTNIPWPTCSKTPSALGNINNYSEVMKSRYRCLYYDVNMLLKLVDDDLYMCSLLERILSLPDSDIHESYGRLYCDCWHNLKSEYRQAVWYDGEPLMELYDIRNCFWTLTAKLLLDRYPAEKEVRRFYDTVKRRIVRRNRVAIESSA